MNPGFHQHPTLDISVYDTDQAIKTAHPQRHIGAFSVLEYLFKKHSSRKRSKISKKIRAMPGASPSKSHAVHGAIGESARWHRLSRDLLVSGFCASSSDRSHRLHDSNVQMLSYLSALGEAFVRRSITRRSTSVRGRASYAMNYSPLSRKCQSKFLSPTLFPAFCTSQLIPECSISPLFCPQGVFLGSIDNFLV